MQQSTWCQHSCHLISCCHLIPGVLCPLLLPISSGCKAFLHVMQKSSTKIYIKNRNTWSFSYIWEMDLHRHWQTSCPIFGSAFSLIFERFWQKGSVDMWSFESSCQNNALPSQSGNLIFVRKCVSMNKDFSFSLNFKTLLVTSVKINTNLTVQTDRELAERGF